MELVERMLAGDHVALSRLITKVENRSEDLSEVMAAIYPHAGRAYTMGVTGPPGSGKSTLTDRLISVVRPQGVSVGVVAVDPSSPFSGGAVLGDRIRMMRHATDPGVFIRSLSSRGSYGGLSRATKEIVKLLDAFGMDLVIVETVGVGQTELDIMELAETTVVVLVPESGDTVQTMKAGITEIADIFVVNKADREGADRIRREIETMVEIGRKDDDAWSSPVISCIAIRGEGVGELWEKMNEHRERTRGRRADPDKLWAACLHDVCDLIVDRFETSLKGRVDAGLLEKYREDLLAGKTNPYSVAMEVLRDAGFVSKILTDE